MDICISLIIGKKVDLSIESLKLISVKSIIHHSLNITYSEIDAN